MATLVEAYLERLGLPAACLADGPTLPLLETLVEAHLATLPFSNLSQHLAGGDAAPSLSPSRLQEKLLARRHGGNCFELNGLFALLLRDIGSGSKISGSTNSGSTKKIRRGEQQGKTR